MAKKFRIIDSHLHFAVKNENLGKNHQEYMNEFGEEKWKKLQQMNKFQQDQWKKAGGSRMRFPNAIPSRKPAGSGWMTWMPKVWRRQYS